MDTIPAEKRSKIMSNIRSKDTQPELKVRKLLYSLGFRYRLHGKNLPGKPDIVFKGKKKVIFVHGCFWHQHADCVHGGIPKSRQEYWEPKLLKNIERDKKNQTKLKEIGWDFLIVWECQLDDMELLSKQLNTFLTP
jgi:DNA mismatch endonuclease (patch repair protein)